MPFDYKLKIIAELEIIRRKEIREGAVFKIRAYNVAIAKIQSLTKIETIEDVKSLRLGEKIYAKVAEIIETGHLAAADRVRADDKTDITSALMNVYGIGPVKARDLVQNQHIKSIEELRERSTELLNDKQRIGLRYYEDILERIPREEMEKHAKLIKTYMCSIWKFDIVGSFRRGMTSSGDIDVLMTLPDNIPPADQKELFAGIVATFKAINYTEAVLAEGDKKFMGIVRLSPTDKARRLDLMLTPAAEYGYALLYFTGSDKFNIKVRARALEMGYTMNEHTMKVAKGSNAPTPPVLKTEEEILAFLNIPFIKPIDRVENILFA